jgi:hypothetical protein
MDLLSDRSASFYGNWHFENYGAGTIGFDPITLPGEREHLFEVVGVQPHFLATVAAFSDD